MKRMITILLSLSLIIAGSAILSITVNSDYYGSANSSNQMNSGSQLTEGSQPTGTRSTLIVGPDQEYTTIGAAIAAASPGDVIRVYSGTYNELVTIGITLSLIGNGSADTVIDGDNTGTVVTVNADRCNVTGFTMKESSTADSGIFLGSDNNTIRDCNCSGNYGRGIEVLFGTDNGIVNCTCNSNDYHGIYLDRSDGNIIMNCTCNTSKWSAGVYLDNSNGNLITDCASDSNTDGVYLMSSSGNIITNCTCNSNGDGIYLGSDKNIVINCTCNSNNNNGIFFGSDSNTVVNCTCNSNIVNGLYLDSGGNKVANCTCDLNRRGIYLISSNNNFIANCICNSNDYDGIYLWSSDVNTIINSSCNSNTDSGIYLRSSDTNTIVNNIFMVNADYGIEADINGNNNLIYHNNFLNNNGVGVQALDNGINNDWDNGTEGNHWSDWTTPDNDGNGIVDNPYDIVGTANAKDNFPLTRPYGMPIITTIDNSTAIEDEFYSVKYRASDPNTPPGSLIWDLYTNAPWLSFPSNNTLYGIPLNSNVGKYWVNISVSDGLFDDFTNFTLEVINVNDPPEINTTDNTTCIEDEPYLVDYNATDIDPTNNVQVWIVSTNATFLSMDWMTGVLSGDPANDDVGQHWVNVSVSDCKGGMDWSNFTLTVNNTNDPPMMVGDDVTEAYEDSLYFRDYDVEDIDLLDNTFTWSIETNASWLDFDESAGNVSGTPANDNVGIYGVNITVKDAALAFGFHNFTLTVHNTNDDPVWDDVPSSATIPVNEPYSFDVNASDVDVGDVLTYSIGSDPISNITIDSESGLIEWTPGSAGEYAINISVTDANVTIDHEFQITVQCDNSLPTAILTSPANNSGSNVLNPTFRWTTSDDDGDNVTSTLYLGETLADIENLNANSRVASDLAGSFFNPTTSLEKGKTYYWSVIPYDGTGTGICSSGIWIFSVSETATYNHLPVFRSEPPLEAGVGMEWKYGPVATDEDADDTVTIDLVIKPDGMTLSSGVLGWTPSGAHLGENDVRLEATDGKGSVFQEFTIIVTEEGPSNHVPVIGSIDDLTVKEGDLISVQITATDEDGDSLAYELNKGPDNAQISNSGLLFWQTNAGDEGIYTMVVKVSDGSLSSTVLFTITVEKAGDIEDDDVRPDDDSEEEGKLSSAVVYIGIIIGLLVVIVVLISIILIVRKKVRKRREKTETPPDESPDTIEGEVVNDDLFRKKDAKKTGKRSKTAPPAVRIDEPATSPLATHPPTEELPLSEAPPEVEIPDVPEEDESILDETWDEDDKDDLYDEDGEEFEDLVEFDEEFVDLAEFDEDDIDFDDEFR